KDVAKLLGEIRDDLYQANRTWLTSIRKQLNRSILDGLAIASKVSKPLSFLSHPVPECSCMKRDPNATLSHASSPSSYTQVQIALGVDYHCPAWMIDDAVSVLPKDKGYEEDIDEEDPISEMFLWHNSNHEVGRETNEKDTQIEDQEELESGER
ncbi:O-fucosyltransferase, partial [Thalictrum thalictroides]